MLFILNAMLILDGRLLPPGPSVQRVARQQPGSPCPSTANLLQKRLGHLKQDVEFFFFFSEQKQQKQQKQQEQFVQQPSKNNKYAKM
jgi:hypothetical protein